MDALKVKVLYLPVREERLVDSSDEEVCNRRRRVSTNHERCVARPTAARLPAPSSAGAQDRALGGTVAPDTHTRTHTHTHTHTHSHTHT